ncbi:MAG: alpha/beta fold hydrolase, partial [Rhizobiaceae bacterium]|nr:alpha/beta fold hydrolase [Rhizobiaceae bacterium]
ISNPLGKFTLSGPAEYLAEPKALKSKSRDGLEIPVLLTLPKGIKPEKVPMIVQVHGGPAAVDAWGYNHARQFLANRGYAVLSVNYRGSTGYGKAFQKAGFRQYGRAMQDDIIDAAKWAINEGIGDGEKVAIYGGSFGGYSALMGVARDPDFFAAAISIVGVSDFEYQIQNSPFSWGLTKAYTTRYFGDAENEQDLREMRENSPVNLIANIKAPILLAHGINDRVVDRAQSEIFERKLKEQGKEYEAYYYEKEGHGFRRWQTKIFYYRKLENFLARHLGGRDGGFDYIEIAAEYID